MKQNLINRINEWKKVKTHYEEGRATDIKARSIVPDEYEIIIRMEIKITLRGESEELKVSRIVKTIGQSVADVELENPNGDIMLFNSFAKELEEDFMMKYDETFSKLLKSKNPDGFGGY